MENKYSKPPFTTTNPDGSIAQHAILIVEDRVRQLGYDEPAIKQIMEGTDKMSDVQSWRLAFASHANFVGAVAKFVKRVDNAE